MKRKSHQRKHVQLRDLKENMSILAYTDFDERYAFMDDLTCQWLQLNFKGAKALVERLEEKLEIGVDQLKTGDSLKQLRGFPTPLKKLTIVNNRLRQELEERGFKRFLVQLTARQPSAKEKKRRRAVRRAEEFIQKSKQSIKVREEAASAVEDFMDKSRGGKADTSDITNYIDDIVNSSSADAISAISSLKQSDQTYAHCIDVGAIFLTVYEKIIAKRSGSNVFEDQRQTLLGAFMHDFGKSKVPKEILDSDQYFERDSQEMRMMRTHPEYGMELLAGMGMPDPILNMAHYHHVKMDTSMDSSYPEEADFKDVSQETRLIAIIDIYQALVGRRSYKKSWVPSAAIRYIDNLSGIEYDPDMWDDFKHMMGRYPKGSFVELSDGSQAFVMNVPETDLERPQVAVVRNENGNDLDRNILLDLSEEKDISIVKELDHYPVFGDSTLDVFTNMQISQ